MGAKAYRLDGYPEMPDTSPRELVDTLTPAARKGDSHAALLIHLAINRCMRAHRDRGDADALLIRAEALGSAEAALAEEAQDIRQCSGLAREDYAHVGDWLSLAADFGNPLAQLLYSMEPEMVMGSLADIIREPERVIAYKTAALSHLKDAASSGSVNALERLGQVYADGILAPADPVMARAYKLAAARADPAISLQEEEESAAKLTASQQADAARIAKEIYRDCCEP
ncbi:sel1 repeat family protein [Stenotrophomonas panacihumi]|nr:sel1 repeat family protein [Stenotrophomonas panacihumi]